MAADKAQKAHPSMADNEKTDAGGSEFDLSEEELAQLSPEEQVIMRQQAEIMRAAEDKKGIDAEMLAAAAELGIPEEELVDLPEAERAIILEQAKIMAQAAEGAAAEGIADSAEDAQDSAGDQTEAAGTADSADVAAVADEGGQESQEEGSLMDIIAQQKASLGGGASEGDTAGTDSSDSAAADDGQPSLQSIIAEQRAQVTDTKSEQTAQQTGTADEGAHTGDTADAEADALLAIVGQQKQGLKVGGADEPGGEQSDSQVKAAPAVAKEDQSDDQPAVAASAKEPAVAVSGGPSTMGRLSRLSMMHVLLMMNGMIVLMVIGVFFSMRNRPQPGADGAVTSELPDPISAPVDVDTNVEIEPGLTWQMAEATYRQGDYATALVQFRHLSEAIQADSEWVFFSDFFRLRVALCLIEMGRSTAAQNDLAQVLESRSPVLRATAIYHAAILDLGAGRFMRARTRGYMALASLGAMKQRVALAGDIDFMIARALTDKALSFHSTAIAVEWGDHWTDPLSGLDDVELTAMLRDGMGREGSAGLGAVVTRAEDGKIGSRWSVVCSGSELEALLHRLGSASQANIRWESVDPKARQRAVTLSAWALPASRLVEIASGSAGLIARFTGEEIIINDPFSGDSLERQRDLIIREGMSAWRRLFLRHRDGPHLAIGHFALASLYECSGDLAGAMREHLMTYRRFPKDAIAPASLLGSARLRIELLDYAGARNDLLELLNSYPDSGSIEEIYQSLGDATFRVGLWEEAIHAYSKLYFLGLSDESRMAASLGCGRCYFASGSYEDADKWLVRYIEIAGKSGEDLAEAYYLLGRARQAMGLMDEAAAAQYCALAAEPSVELRADIVLTVAGLEADRDELVRAAGVLESLDVRRLTGDQAFEYLLLYSRVHRTMGITERALVFLKKNRDMVTEPQQRARVNVELARCHADLGELKKAQQLLSTALLTMAPGAEAQVAALELAEACLKTDDVAGAIALADRVARIETSDEIHRRARNILGQAYLINQNYNAAVQVLSGLHRRYDTGGRNGSDR